MADAAFLLKASQEFLTRNNPLESILKAVSESIDFVMNYNSKLKLIRYKFMLAKQQMNTMEHFVSQGSPYEVRGNKIDKAY